MITTLSERCRKFCAGGIGDVLAYEEPVQFRADVLRRHRRVENDVDDVFAVVRPRSTEKCLLAIIVIRRIKLEL